MKRHLRSIQRQKRSTLSSNLEYLGEDFIQRVTKAVRKETWGRTVIQLAWTAGPVTYLALQGGYILGYGTSAPPNLFIYFAIYTVIAGLFAVLMRLLYQMTRGQEIEKAEAALTQALDRLPDLILFSRNQSLLYYEKEDRILLAAKYLLENPDAVAETVRTAVYDSTKQSILADTAQRIEIYRKNGLFARIEDEYEQIADKLEKAVTEIKRYSPAVADLLTLRMQGKPPRKRTGRVRTEGFISRVLAAGEEHNFDLMSLHDAEEIFTLAYELLADRTIPVFSLRYIGSREFTDASEAFDRARLAFRKAAYLRNSRLRNLAVLFAEYDQVDIVPAATPVFTTPAVMYENIQKAIDILYRDIKKQMGRSPLRRRKQEPDSKLVEDLAKLQSAIDLYQSLRSANIQLQRKYEALERAEEKYLSTKNHAAKNFPLRLLGPKERGRGIRIVQRQVALSKNSKLRFAKGIGSLLAELDIKKNKQLALNHPHEISDLFFYTEEYKKLAVDMAMLLEKELTISRFEIQYAVESSNAPYLASLEWGLTAATKTGWAVSLVREVQKNMQTPIHKLAHVLVNYHEMPFDEKSINFLAKKYGADPYHLAQLIPEKPEGDPTKEASERPVGKPTIFPITPLDPKYREIID